MTTNDFDGTAASYLRRLQQTLANSVSEREIDNAISVIAKAWKEGRQVITFGNGGSAMTALHFIADWNKSVYLRTGVPFRGRSLVDNMGLAMAYGNDLSFADLFVEQLKNVMQPGDLAIAISGSGNSENVIRAVDYANANGAVTLGLCGFGGGRLRERAQHLIWARVEDMQLVEDVHAVFGHITVQRLAGYAQQPE